MRGNKDKDRLEVAQARARISPARARMLDLYEEDPTRSMEPAALFEELTGEGWDVTVSQVNYHLQKLVDAELIPAPNGS